MKYKSSYGKYKNGHGDEVHSSMAGWKYIIITMNETRSLSIPVYNVPYSKLGLRLIWKEENSQLIHTRDLRVEV